MILTINVNVRCTSHGDLLRSLKQKEGAAEGSLPWRLGTRTPLQDRTGASWLQCRLVPEPL